MNKTAKIAAGAIGFGAIFWALSQATAKTDARLTKTDIRALASRLIREYGLDASPDVAASIAMIESSGNPLAIRLEPWVPHVGGPDYSSGLMQVLVTTAQWLARDMGYSAFGIPNRSALMDAETSMYFGLAYLDYLKSHRRADGSLSWIVQSYNAGPGNSSPAYWAKFEKEHM